MNINKSFIGRKVCVIESLIKFNQFFFYLGIYFSIQKAKMTIISDSGLSDYIADNQN